MRALLKTAAALGAAALAPILCSGPAQAAPAADGTVYFSYGFADCAIGPDGSVGCNADAPVTMTMKIAGAEIVLPFPVDEAVIDLGWAPAHPGFVPGKPYTLPGGNPPIEQLGGSVSHAGATCAIGFRASLSCDAKGHRLSLLSGTFYGS